MKNIMHELVMGKSSKQKKMDPLSVMGKSKVGKAMHSNRGLMNMFPTQKRKPSQPQNLLGNMMPNVGNIKGMYMKKPKKQPLMPKLKGIGIVNPMTDLSSVNILGDKKTKQQVRYLKMYKGTHRFNDYDKDGVVNGLDCHWRDPTRHGIVSWLKEKFKKPESQPTKAPSQTYIEAPRRDDVTGMSTQPEQKVESETLEEYKKRLRRDFGEEPKIYEDYPEMKPESETAEVPSFTPGGRERYDPEGRLKTEKIEYEEPIEKPEPTEWLKKERWQPYGIPTLKERFKEAIKSPETKAKEYTASLYEIKEKDIPEEEKFRQAQELKEKYEKARGRPETEKEKLAKKYVSALYGIKEADIPEDVKYRRAKMLRKSYEFERQPELVKKFQVGVAEAESRLDVAKEKAKEFIDEKTQGLKEFQKEKGERVGEFIEARLMEKGFVQPKRKPGEERQRDEKGRFTKEKSVYLRRPLSRKVGYALESKEMREKMREEDIEKKRTEAVLAALAADTRKEVTPEKIKKLSDLYAAGTIDKLQYERELERIKNQEAKQKKEQLEKQKVEEIKREFELKGKPIEAQFQRQMMLDALRKQEASKVNIEKAKYEIGRLRQAQEYEQRYAAGRPGRLSEFLAKPSMYGQTPSYGSPESSIAEQGFFRPRVVEAEYTEQPYQQYPQQYEPPQPPPRLYQPRYQFEEPQSGYYDPNAPRFVYQRDLYSFTRKTPRVVAGERLVLGQPSQPSFKKREGSRYPWTKPMRGWKRVYVGKGRQVGKGRKRRSRSPLIREPEKQKFKITKFAFQPSIKTYGYDAMKYAR